MQLPADVLTITLAAVLAALLFGMALYALAARRRAARGRHETVQIRAAIIDYFRRSGVVVSAECASFDGNRRFIAVVESEPMKRFRLSHIIEMTLREHIRKTCGLELDKVYWRFPIKDATQQSGQTAAMPQQAPSEEKRPDENSDEYINEGLEHYRHIPKPEVTELPWETFEEFSTVGRQAGGDGTKKEGA